MIKGPLDCADNQFGGSKGFSQFWGVVWIMELRKSVSLHILCAGTIGDLEIETSKEKCSMGLTGVQTLASLKYSRLLSPVRTVKGCLVPFQQMSLLIKSQFDR